VCMARKSYSSVIEYLKNVHKRSDSFLMLLNHGDSEENVQTSKQACCRGANDNLIDDWIALMTKKKTKRKTGKVAVQNVEKTAPEVESMGKIKSSVDKSVHVDEFGLSCQDNHQIGEGPGTNPVEYLNAICNKEIPNDVTESNQQNKPMLNDLSDKFHDVEEFVESTEKSVSTDDDSMKHDIGCCYLEAPNVVKTQKQPDSTSEIADHLPILKEADNVDGLHYTLTAGGIEATSNAIGPAVGANVVFVDGAAELKFNEHFAAGGIEATSNAIGLTVGANVVSVGGAADIAENVNSSGVAMADSMQKKMTSGTVVSSQVDLVELGASTLAHKINSVCSTNDVGKKVHNEKSSTSITYRENFGKNEQSKEMAADPISHGSNTVSGTDNIRENEKDEEMTPVGFSSLGDKLQGKDDAETMMQNADTTAGSPSDETKVEQNMKFVFEGNTEDTESNEIDHTTCQQTMAVPNSHKFVLVTPSNSVQERIDDKTSADCTLY